MTSKVIYSLLNGVQLLDLEELARTSPPGNFVEVGVYKGGSAQVLYRIAEQQGRVLHLYDTFIGHTVVDAVHDNWDIHPLGNFADNRDMLEMLQRAMPHAQIHPGTFPSTLVDMGPVAFVHSDVDLYWPTVAVCQQLPPIMVPGGRLLFDDYPYSGCPGVKEAVHQVFPEPAITIRPGGQALVTLS